MHFYGNFYFAFSYTSICLPQLKTKDSTRHGQHKPFYKKYECFFKPPKSGHVTEILSLSVRCLFHISTPILWQQPGSFFFWSPRVSNLQVQCRFCSVFFKWIPSLKTSFFPFSASSLDSKIMIFFPWDFLSQSAVFFIFLKTRSTQSLGQRLHSQVPWLYILFVSEDLILIEPPVLLYWEFPQKSTHDSNVI